MISGVNQLLEFPVRNSTFKANISTRKAGQKKDPTQQINDP